MANDITRLRYYTGEFLQKDDFDAEQAYHRRLRHLHNHLLHTWGIASGLDVNPVAADPMRVTVEPGMGLVKVNENSEDLAKEVVLTAQRSVTLPGTANAIVYILIGYLDTDGSPDAQGNNMRTSEGPSLRAFVPLNAASIPNNEAELILAKITMNGTGTGIAVQMGIPSIDRIDRKSAGIRGDVEATNVRFPSGAPSPQWPNIRSIAMPVGALQIAATQVNFTGDLTLGPGKTVAGVDIPAHVAASAAGALGHVMNGNSHNHTAGAGGQIDHASLSNAGTATNHVTNGDSHDHNGGDGAPIPWAAVLSPTNLLRATAFARVTIAGGVPTVDRQFGLQPQTNPAANTNGVFRVSAGVYRLNWVAAFAASNDPVLLLTVRDSSFHFWYRFNSTTNTSADIQFIRADNTQTDPGGFSFLVL